MRRPKLATVLVLAVAASLMVGVMPANAVVFDVHADFAEVQNGRVTDVFGHIECTPGHHFVLRVNVTDSSGNKAVGRASGVCGGGQNGPSETSLGTPWVTGRVVSDTGFTCDEELLARGQARTTEDGDRGRINNFIFTCPLQ